MADDGTERDRSPRRKDKKSKWGAEEGASLPPPVPKAAGKKSKWGADDVEASPPAAEPKAASMTNADFAASLFDDPSLYQQPGVVPGKNPASGSNFSGAPLKDQASLGDDPNLNPLTGKPYSKRYFEILEKRKTLPCTAARKDFLKLVKKNQCTILVGETGSGKTTQMPQFILDAGYATYGKAVACTQPRRVAAMSVAQRVADEMDVEIGTYCGYSIRFEDCTSKDTLLKYMTDGMLLREAMTDPELTRYAVIILDEAHERTLATDVLFGLLKKVAQRRPDLKLVVMSATLDAEKMQGYFSNAPMISVPGRTFPVEIFYTPEAEKDYLQAALRTALMIHDEEPEGDILIFLTGEDEIEYACRTLMSSARAGATEKGELRAIPLYSSLPPHLQKRIFDPPPQPRYEGGPVGRKVIVSTNVAETSVTIDGIVYVVDPGLSKQKVFNPRIKVESLLVSPISRASASQRAGRAGRTRPGKCFRLYTEEGFNTILLPQTYPEILRSNLANTVLTLLKLGIDDLVHFDFLDPPAPETLMHALMHLRNLGALDEEMKLTNMGRLMSEFPLDPNASKMLIDSCWYRCSADMLSIVAMLSVPQIFVRGKEGQKEDAQKAKDSFAHMDGDHLQLLQAFHAYTRMKNDTGGTRDVEHYCRSAFLNYRSLTSADSVRKQLEALLQKQHLPIVEGSERDDPDYYQKLRKALVAGCFTNVARLQPDGKHKDKYLNVRDGQAADLHPSTCLKFKPEWVVYHDIVLTAKNCIRTVTKVQPEWLLEVAPEYFSGKLVKLPPSLAARELTELQETGKITTTSSGGAGSSGGPMMGGAAGPMAPPPDMQWTRERKEEELLKMQAQQMQLADQQIAMQHAANASFQQAQLQQMMQQQQMAAAAAAQQAAAQQQMTGMGGWGGQQAGPMSGGGQWGGAEAGYYPGGGQ